MPEPEPIFCYEALDDREYSQYLLDRLKSCRLHDLDSQQMLPYQCRENAKFAVILRSQVLMRVYNGDYHTDSVDVPRLSKSVAEGAELIWFWGNQMEINRIKNAPNDTFDAKLGTVSALDATREMGCGFGELCRSGSISDVPATPFSILRILNYITCQYDELHQKYHTLFIVPRVRSTTALVRGGEAVNTLQKRTIRSRFFGFAPWYVMQGGVLEILEYRELHRNYATVVSCFCDSSTLYFSDECDLKFVESLFIVNYGHYRPRLKKITGGSPQHPLNLSCVSACPEGLKQFNHITFLANADATSIGKSDLTEIDPDILGVACTVVKVNLTDIRLVYLQQRLNGAGYVLTSITPGKNLANSGGYDAITTFPAFGFWSKPCRKIPREWPFYMKYRSVNNPENDILARLQLMSSKWDFKDAL